MDELIAQINCYGPIRFCSARNVLVMQLGLAVADCIMSSLGPTSECIDGLYTYEEDGVTWVTNKEQDPR